MGPLIGPPGAVLEWAVQSVPYPGLDVCGDDHLLCVHENGVLLAVIDGLGHGSEAAGAAREARQSLCASPGDPVPVLLERVHQRLRNTRGAAISLASLSANDGLLTWVGVGNVEALVLRTGGKGAREWLTPIGGIVGDRFQGTPRPTVISLRRDDVVAFATDGIDEKFASHADPRLPPVQLAERILTRFWRGSDDALVLVARFLGEGA